MRSSDAPSSRADSRISSGSERRKPTHQEDPEDLDHTGCDETHVGVRAEERVHLCSSTIIL